MGVDLRGNRIVQVFAGLGGAFLYIYKCRQGLVLTPDSWALWQGAISILDGKGYVYFSGTQIVAWPPLYSSYVAFWSYFLGRSAFSVLFANSILVFITVFGWMKYSDCILKSVNQRGAISFQFLTMTFISFYVALNGITSATLLAFAILPFLIVALWRIVNAAGKIDHIDILITSGLLTVLLMSHNLSVIFVPGVVASVLLMKGPTRSKIFYLLWIAVVPVMAWVLLRSFLGQAGSHPMNGTNMTVLGNTLDLMRGVASNFFPTSLALAVIFLSLLLIGGLLVGTLMRLSIFWFAMVIVFSAGISLVLIFSMVFINGSLEEHRFSHFVPLLLVPVILFSVLDQKFLTTVVGLILIPVLVFRFLEVSLVPDQNLVPLSASISALPKPREILVVNGETLIGLDPWEEPLNGYTPDGRPKWGLGQTEETVE
jgi:hypothetical protein